MQGFDEYMNLVLDDAEEVNIKKKSKKTLGMPSSPSFVVAFSLVQWFSKMPSLFFSFPFREDSPQRRQHYVNDEHVSEIELALPLPFSYPS